MPSNLPPGVTESMIPGNRPEDQEIEVTIILTNGEIDDIVNFNDESYSFIWERITDQIRGLYD